MLALRPLLVPAPPGEISPVTTADGCALATPGAGPPCRCDALPTELRRLYDLPLPLNRSSVAALEQVPGIGPVRAESIARERERVTGIRVRDKKTGEVKNINCDLNITRSFNSSVLCLVSIVIIVFIIKNMLWI